MDGHLVDLTVIQVTDPGNFLAKEVANVSRKNMSAEYCSFLTFAQQMKKHFESEHVSILQTPPKIGAMYAGKRQSDQCWYRVNIINIFTTTRGQQAQCELVDYGKVELISTNLIRTLPKDFSYLPYQVQKYCLCGIQPLTLGFNEDIIAVKRPCSRWDNAAIEFFRNVIEESDNIQAKIVIRDPKGTNSVMLHVKWEDRQFCVNDELCRLEYATHTTSEISTPTDKLHKPESRGSGRGGSGRGGSGRDKRTIDEYLKDQKRRIKMQSEGSQPESDIEDYYSMQTNSDVPEAHEARGTTSDLTSAMTENISIQKSYETHYVRETTSDSTRSMTEHNSMQANSYVPETIGTRGRLSDSTSYMMEHSSMQTSYETHGDRSGMSDSTSSVQKSYVPETHGARVKISDYTGYNTDSSLDSYGKVRAVPAGLIPDNQTLTRNSQSHSTPSVRPSNRPRSALTTASSGDVPLLRGVTSRSDSLRYSCDDLDLSDIPLPRGVRSAPDTQHYCSGDPGFDVSNVPLPRGVKSPRVPLRYSRDAPDLDLSDIPLPRGVRSGRDTHCSSGDPGLYVSNVPLPRGEKSARDRLRYSHDDPDLDLSEIPSPRGVKSARDTLRYSDDDLDLDLSEIPAPRGVKSSPDTLAYFIGKGYFSQSDGSGSEGRVLQHRQPVDLAGDYSKLCRPRPRLNLSSVSDSSEVDDMSGSPRKIGRGQMLVTARGGNIPNDDVHSVQQAGSRQNTGVQPGGSDKTAVAARTITQPLFEADCRSDNDFPPSMSPRKMGRGNVLSELRAYISDTDDLSGSAVLNVGKEQLHNDEEQYGRRMGKGILSKTPDDYRRKSITVGRGQIMTSPMLISGSSSSDETILTPTSVSPMAVAPMTVIPTPISVSVGNQEMGVSKSDETICQSRSLGQVQRLLNMLNVRTVGRGRSEREWERYEDAEDRVGSSQVDRDKTKNIKEESVNIEPVRARENLSIITEPINLLRTEPINSLRTEPISLLRTEPINLLKTRPINLLRTGLMQSVRTEPIGSVNAKPIDTLVSDTYDQSDARCRTSKSGLCLSLPFTKSRLPKFVEQQTTEKQTTEKQPSQKQTKYESGTEGSVSEINPKETKETSLLNVRFADNDMSTHIPEKFLQMKREIEGRKLLDMIRPRSMGSRSTVLPQISRADQPIPNPFLGVIVHGISQPVPMLDFSDLPFAENIKKVFEDKADIMYIQSFTWTPIMRGRCVVGISPARSGKTLAYLPAIFTQTFSSSSYLDVPRGNGPLVLILVPSWIKAQGVYDLCNSLFIQRRKRVISIYAGGCEDGYEIPLINGCEILIATPPCLNRMLEKNYTNLNRLCHLVLDDAEILTEEFTTEIQTVMASFSESRKQQKLHSLTTQLLVFASQWTPGIESFAKVFLNEPLIVITSRCEAAVYGKVKQVVHMCSSEQHLAMVCGLLDEIGIPGEKIVICTSDISQVSNIQQLLSTRSVMCLAVHHMSEPQIKDQTVNQWSTMDSIDSCVVLVTNDESLVELAIVDATAVIHFDLPNSKTKFGARLGCMTNYFHDITAIDKKPKPPTSHIIVRNDLESSKNIQSLMKFLKRSKCKIPPQLSDMVAGMKAWQNEDRERPLCRNLKAFGFCVNESQCMSRHLIIREVDNVTDLGNSVLPSCGEVKVRLNHIVDASHFYMRVLEHRLPDGSTNDFSGIYLELLMTMAQHFNAKKNRKSLREVKRGMICAFDDGHNTFHRVKIVEWKEDTLDNKAKAEVWFVDEGKQEMVFLQDLRLLPKELAVYPYQAVEVFLAHIKPIDKDSEWTPKVNTFIIDQLKKHQNESHADDQWRLDGRVRLSLGNTMWLDPIVKRSVLEGINVVTNKCNVRKELIKNRLAEDNPKHIENLYKLCESFLDKPEDHAKKGLDGESLESLIDTEVLPRDTQYHDVIVSAVISPDLFYVQRKQTSVQLNEMLDEINEKISKKTLRLPLDVSLTCGSLCLAQFSQDERWYRGKIIEEVDDGFRVDFFDYGDKETVDRSRLKVMPTEYSKLLCQAIECRLDGVKPKDLLGDVWDDRSANALWDMAHFLTNEKRFLVAKVISESPSSLCDSQKYSVALYDTTSHDDVSLAQELVWKGYAYCDTTGDLKDLFCRPTLSSTKVYPSSLHKIEDLCSLIYWSQDDNADLSTSKSAEVRDIITENMTSARFGDSLVESGAVSDLCCLIGYLTSVEAHEDILYSIVQAMFHSESVCQACLAEGICTSLLRCIEQGLIPEIQQQACKALSDLIVNESFISAFGESRPTSTLCDFLDTTDDVEIRCSVYRLLTALLKGSESVSCEVKSSGICQKASVMLSEQNHELVETLLSFFAAVAAWESCHSEVKRQAVLEGVIDNMSNSHCSKCISHCARFCDNLSKENRKNKTLLLEYKVVVVLNRLLTQSLDGETRHLCEKLESSLVEGLRLPEQQVIMNNQPVHPDSASSSTPVVTWVQNTFKILLTVKVSGASKDDFKITENFVHFRRSCSGVEQGFDYELFGKIIPQATGISVRSTQVLLSLRKVEKGKWSRLTKLKQKNKNLTVDFDNIVDSSENEISDEEDPFALVKEKHKLPVHEPGQPIRKDHLELPIFSESEDSDFLSLSDQDEMCEDFLG